MKTMDWMKWMDRNEWAVSRDHGPRRDWPWLGANAGVAGKRYARLAVPMPWVPYKKARPQ